MRPVAAQLSVTMEAPSSSTLLLAPDTTLAQPGSWQRWTEAWAESPGARYDEVTCVGGGTLLLWLLVRAGRAPRCRNLVVSGPVVLPSPSSCGAWVGADKVDEYGWRRQAVSLGANGFLHKPGDAWLEPIMTTLACGRYGELEADALQYLKRWGKRVRYEPYASESGHDEGLVTPQLDGDPLQVALKLGGRQTEDWGNEGA